MSDLFNTHQTPQQKQAMDNEEGSRGHAEELVDHYWYTMNYMVELIRTSEIKAGLILSFYGIVISFIFQTKSELYDPKLDYTMINILMSIWGVATLISIFFCMRCFMPKIEGNYNKNVFFFGDVISKFGDIEKFSEKFYKVSLSETEMCSQLGEQIYINAKIAAWKFKNIGMALRSLSIGLMFLFASAIFYSIYYL